MIDAPYPWQSQAWSLLQKMVVNNRMPHALLIHGENGLGKLNLAHYLVRLILCKNPKDNHPCLTCDSCMTLMRDDLSDQASQKELLIRHSYEPSVLYCRAELNNKGKKISHDVRIDQVRKFCQSLYKTSDRFKIGLLWYGDFLNAKSADSLLKTLEEPPERTLIILVAHQKSSLGKTILSRTQQVVVNTSQQETIAQWLNDEIKTQSIDIKLKNAQSILKQCHYQPLKTLEILKSKEWQEYQQWHDYLIELAYHSSTPTLKQPTSVLVGLNCLSYLLIEINKHQLNNQINTNEKIIHIAKHSQPIFLLKLLEDSYHAIKLSQTNINMTLLLDNLLIIWSHITHLAHYPTIIKK